MDPRQEYTTRLELRRKAFETHRRAYMRIGQYRLGIFALARLTGNDARLATEKAAVFNGVLLQMFNHGLTAATVFCLLSFIERRGGTREYFPSDARERALDEKRRMLDPDVINRLHLNVKSINRPTRIAD